MKNRAHQEPKEKRVKRLDSGSPVETIETLLNSIANFFNNEIALTADYYQTSLLFLGIHAVALTVTEAFFDKSGLDGYTLFLENFVDGNDNDKKFSKIAEYIHSWRNILAHQWLSLKGYSIGYDYEMVRGWDKRDEVIFINPKIYLEQYLKAFSTGGKIWKYNNLFSPKELEEIKNRIVGKFLEE